MQRDDADLVRAVLQGDQQAFGLLYDRYARLVRVICHDTTRDLQKTQDLAQEAFLRAYQKLDRLKSPDRFGAWLAALARNVCREYRRSQARNRHVLVGLDPEPAVEQKPSTEDDRLALLREAIERLPEKQKMALRVYYLQGEDVENARNILGLSRSSFYRLLEKAKHNVEEFVRKRNRPPGQ